MPRTSPASPQKAKSSLIEGFFYIVKGQQGTPEARISWPQALHGSRLEQAVVRDGFCPVPAVFSAPDPAGFGNEPFVFSLLETTLDPAGDPSGVLYGCVCSEVDGAPCDPASPRSTVPTISGTSGPSVPTISGTSGPSVSVEQPNLPPAGVLCIVSKLPIFSLLFSVLRLLRMPSCLNSENAGTVLQRLNCLGLGEKLATEGVDVSDLESNVNRLRLELPLGRPPACGWTYFSRFKTLTLTPAAKVSQTFAQWQAAWGLKTLFSRWDNLVGDTLAKLLASVLLEQKILLLGDVPRISTVALVLRALMWPFRWLHPYLSAPPPADLLSMPLLEATFPVIIALTELPKQWDYRTHYELPPDVVTGVLKHDYVYVSPDLETSGGLKGTALKLPAKRHTAFLKQVAQAKRKLRTKEIDIPNAVDVVLEAAGSEVQHLAEIVRRYTRHQVSEARAKLGASKAGDKSSNVAEFGMALQEAELRDQCSEVDAFAAWFAVDNPEMDANGEPMSFYKTFFQTQLCLEFLREEIAVQIGAEAA